MSCCSYWHILSNPIPQYDCITNKARKATTKFKDRTEDEQGKKIPFTKQTKKGHTLSAKSHHLESGGDVMPKISRLEKQTEKSCQLWEEQHAVHEGHCWKNLQAEMAMFQHVQLQNARLEQLRCREVLGFPLPTRLQHMSPHCHIEVAQMGASSLTAGDSPCTGGTVFSGGFTEATGEMPQRPQWSRQHYRKEGGKSLCRMPVKDSQLRRTSQPHLDHF
ncbi:uncharacterized protein LOC115336421 isoform X2 [Aquila chrysaetos chrysaetos]|uniref:uncharacterized protein LOC115336421 isoform X2 n=1 Tax=Aquila chrysaetos chrysaetos TaxID=223781 RepID=UPI0011764E65|nr:uncharacterized protein LOC115336421 isoform X2 [Aquila chrysaetos chrysaetos]